MSKAQIVAEIVGDIDDGDFKEVVKKGLGQANLVSLEWVLGNIKATITQQNKKQQPNKNEMKRNLCNNGSSFFTTHMLCHTISSSVIMARIQFKM